MVGVDVGGDMRLLKVEEVGAFYVREEELVGGAVFFKALDD